VYIPAPRNGTRKTQYSHKLMWNKANINGYKADVCVCVSSVELPVKAILCKECCDVSYLVDIKNYYNSLINCLKSASDNNTGL